MTLFHFFQWLSNIPYIKLLAHTLGKEGSSSENSLKTVHSFDDQLREKLIQNVFDVVFHFLYYLFSKKLSHMRGFEEQKGND